MKSWIIIDEDTGAILGQADGYSEIKALYKELSETLPEDGHEWGIYGRPNA